MTLRRSTLILNLAYLALVGGLLAGAWYEGQAWFAGWRHEVESDWVALNKRRWETAKVLGVPAGRNLLIAEEKSEDRRAQLILLCFDDATLHLLSKTIIGFDDAYKPYQKTWIVNATLIADASDKQEIALPNMAWSFVDGLDRVLSPSLADKQLDALTVIFRDTPSAKIMLSHSETAIFVRPSTSYDAVKIFTDHCKQSRKP